MTVDVQFGRMEPRENEDGAYEWCVWPGDPTEQDGTEARYRIGVGKPWRSFGWSGWAEWINDVPEARAFVDGIGHPGSNDYHTVKLTDDVQRLIDALPDVGGVNGDRHKFFKYWSRRARETFGDAAVMFWC